MGNPGLVLQLFFHLSLQNLLFKSSKHTHVTPLLFQRHWLLVNFKVHFKILVLVLRALHGQAPSYNGDLLSPNTPSRSLRSSDQSLVVHNSLKTKSDRSLLLWPPNSGTLLLSLRSVDSVVYFKKKKSSVQAGFGVTSCSSSSSLDSSCCCFWSGFCFFWDPVVTFFCSSHFFK